MYFLNLKLLNFVQQFMVIIELQQRCEEVRVPDYIYDIYEFGWQPFHRLKCIHGPFANDPYNDNVTYAYCSLCILKE